MHKKIVNGIIGIEIIFVVSLLFLLSGLGQSLEQRGMDALYQKGNQVNPEIILIGIEEKTLDRYGNVADWSRDIPAELVEILNQSEETKPAIIGFDIFYSEDKAKQGDEHFASVCGNYDNIVTAVGVQFQEQPETDVNGDTFFNPYHVEGITAPYEALEAATEQAFVNTVIEEDGVVRRSLYQIDGEGQNMLSFSAKIYEMVQQQQGKEVTRPALSEGDNSFYFSYSGKSGSYTCLPLVDVIDKKVDPKIFKDSIVLVGPYAVGMQDSYIPAVQHNGQMYGVEIHGNILQALLEGKTQQEFPRLAYIIIAAIFCVLVGIIFGLLSVKWNVLTLVVALGLDVAFGMVMFDKGYIVPFVKVGILVLLLFVARVIGSYIHERKRRQHVVSMFRQYVAPQIVEKVSKDKEYQMVLKGENRHIAVLFVDIRGFTTMSEALEPEQVVEILNEYLSLTTSAIFAQEGTLDKFVGDATMAVFNAPFDMEDYVYRAVCAAKAMKEGADALLEKYEKKYHKTIAFGIGVHCGNAVVGNIGCDFRMDYTAIGDTVNTAARLESNAKAGQILISQDVVDILKNRIKVSPIGAIPLKGKQEEVMVYQLDEVK